MFQFLKGVGEVKCSLLMTKDSVEEWVFSTAAWISFLLMVKVAVPQCARYPANLQATRLKCVCTLSEGKYRRILQIRD